MALQIIGLFLLFTSTGASESSGHLEFMSGAKNILHVKDPGVEVGDFSDSFRHIASLPDKVKTTFRILNQPNDSRFKFDLMLILSKLLVLEDETQSFENKKNAWSVLYPLLVKYDQNFTYPNDYDIESGDYMEITVRDWMDRYTPKEVVSGSPRKADDRQVGSGHSSESFNRQMKSLMDLSRSVDKYLWSLEQESKVLPTQEGSGSVEEHPGSEEDVLSALSDRATTKEESAEETESEEEASVEEVEVHREYRGDDEMLVHSAASFDPIEQETTSEGYVLQQTDGSHRGYELHFTTEDESTSYKIGRSDDGESSTEYRIVSTADKELGLMDEATTEYYVPEVEMGGSDLLGILSESGVENSEEMQATHFVDGDDLMLQHRVGYAVEVHPEEIEKEPIQAGSIRGIPGVHFPDYEEIPITSFSCADKKYVPGFYADLETGCQVFHVCWPHRRESFLCPIGTLFNQAILACDYWYSTNCSLSHYYDDVNDRIHQSTTPRPPTHKPSPTKPCPHPEQSSRATPSYHPKQPTYSTPSYQSEQPSHSTPSYHPEQPSRSTPSYHPKQPTYSTPSFQTELPSHSTPSYHPEPPATPSISLADVDWKSVISILPIKSKVYVYPPHQVTKLSKTAPAKSHFAKTAKDEVLNEAIVSKIVSKVLQAAELMAKSARPLVSQIPAAQLPKKQKGIPKINPKFVVRSSDKLDDMKAILAAKGVARKVKKTKMAKERIPPSEDIVLGAMEMAGTVLQKDILPLTRMALVEGSLKHLKSKKH